MFDPGGSNSCSMMARADGSAWDSSTGWAGLGISTTVSASKYCYRIESTVLASAVPRTAGWHKLSWDYTSGTNVVLSIDDTNVVTANNTAAFQTIAFGDWWGDGVVANGFFDDVLIAPQPTNNDTDHNGLDDTWETLYFGHLLGAPGAALDADADGLSNQAEYQAGTNPTDSKSYLRILAASTAPGNDSFQLTFASVPGRAYDLQSAAALASPVWSDTQTNLVASGGETTLVVPSSIHVSTAFFRLRLRTP